MSFVGPLFVILVLLAGLGYRAIPARRRPLYLVTVSYAYYATWSAPHAALMLATTAFAFLVAQRIGRRPDGDAVRARWFVFGIAGLLGLLGVFKYTRDVAALLPTGWAPGLSGTMLGIALPVGISYYVFKLLSYVVEVHWGDTHAETSVVRLAAYTSFAPQILSGPLQRESEFVPQLAGQAEDPAIPSLSLATGMRRILFGLFKKVVIADALGDFVNLVFGAPGMASPLRCIVAANVFALQLYSDFAGLTDIAIGAGLLFGIEAPPNFNLPFLAPNVQEFWRRWHMTLTRMIGDYVFMPLRMRLRAFGAAGLALAVLLNMIAIALWHGARSSFLAFGVISAFYMIVSIFTLKHRDRFWKGYPWAARPRRIVGTFLTFELTVVALVFFRAESFGVGATLIHQVVTGPHESLRAALLPLTQDHRALLGLVALPLIDLVERSTPDEIAWSRWPWLARGALYSTLVVTILLVRRFRDVPFIYFRF